MDSNEIDRSFSTTSLASALKTAVTLARLGKTTQNFFHRWLFITAFIIKTSAFLFLTIVLFISQIYLFLPLKKCRWKGGFEEVTNSFVSSFKASKNLSL